MLMGMRSCRLRVDLLQHFRFRCFQKPGSQVAYCSRKSHLAGSANVKKYIENALEDAALVEPWAVLLVLALDVLGEPIAEDAEDGAQVPGCPVLNAVCGL